MLYTLKFTKFTVQKHLRKPAPLYCGLWILIMWAPRYAITKSLYMQKSASKAQAPGFGKKQAYNVKVHAKKAQGLKVLNRPYIMADLEDAALYPFEAAS